MVEENVSWPSKPGKSGNFSHINYTRSPTHTRDLSAKATLFYASFHPPQNAAAASLTRDDSPKILPLNPPNPRAHSHHFSRENCVREVGSWGNQKRASRASMNPWMGSQKSWNCLIDKKKKNVIITAARRGKFHIFVPRLVRDIKTALSRSESRLSIFRCILDLMCVWARVWKGRGARVTSQVQNISSARLLCNNAVSSTRNKFVMQCANAPIRITIHDVQVNCFVDTAKTHQLRPERGTCDD